MRSLEHHAQQIRLAVDLADEDLEMLDRALEMLDEYDFAADLSAVRVYAPGYGTGGSTTSTWRTW